MTQRSTARQYLELTKPRVVALIVFTAVIGMFLAVPGLPPPRQAIAGMFGIWLAAASAAALNHLIDQRIDKLMARTSHRPLATGALTPTQVLAFALILGTLSMAILIALVNPLTALLTFFSLIGYAVVYTAYLKRATPQNIVIGGAAGAAPPVLGWVAVTGQLHPYALLLFLIIFIWTPPHFWALAIFRRDDYARAQVPMLPVTHDGASVSPVADRGVRSAATRSHIVPREPLVSMARYRSTSCSAHARCSARRTTAAHCPACTCVAPARIRAVA